MESVDTASKAPPSAVKSKAPGQDLLELIEEKNRRGLSPADPLSRVGGSLAFHSKVSLRDRKVLDAAAMATAFRGYEALLPGKDLKQVGLVSSMAAGICGGVHATASALCLEMALGLRPPPLGIVLRNLLLSCQYLNDNTMHLFILAGPDYSEDVMAATNPEIWHQAGQSPAANTKRHGYKTIGAIMRDLNKGRGKLYQEALAMVKTARQAYTLLGGKYPHSESLVPGGVSLNPDPDKIDAYQEMLKPFVRYSDKTVALWEDIFNFMLDCNPRYEELGSSAPSMLDFGQWDHEDYYDAAYVNCDSWGEKRWSTPGALILGELKSTRLSELNAGLEEFTDHSYYQSWLAQQTDRQGLLHDPKGNVLSPLHPWNKTIIPSPNKNREFPEQAMDSPAYSWATSLTWRRHNFEVGAYARLYISALAGKIPDNPYACADGKSLQLNLPDGASGDVKLSWNIPKRWNAFERNRARAYAQAFNFAILQESVRRARHLLKNGETAVRSPMKNPEQGRSLGVGLWGAGRGFLAHWAVLDQSRIENYQIAIPSRINAQPRSPWGTPGPCEAAVLNTPILESGFQSPEEFQGIDIQRALQSFDPCMSCTTHTLIDGTDMVFDKEVDTSFPI